MHARGATRPVIAARVANTNIAASRRTTHKRRPHGQKPQQKRLLGRPRRPRRLPHDHQRSGRTSLGRRPLLVASSRARGRHARSVAAERGDPAGRPGAMILGETAAAIEEDVRFGFQFGVTPHADGPDHGLRGQQIHDDRPVRLRSRGCRRHTVLFDLILRIIHEQETWSHRNRCPVNSKTARTSGHCQPTPRMKSPSTLIPNTESQNATGRSAGWARNSR